MKRSEEEANKEEFGVLEVGSHYVMALLLLSCFILTIIIMVHWQCWAPLNSET